MQTIGHSTTTANAAGEYTQGQPGSGIDATMITAAWLNAVQRELINVISGSGQTLDPADDAQLLKAVKALQELANTWVNIAGKPTTVSGYGLTDVFTKVETSQAINKAVADIVASSPAALDTLSELAAALGNDANFSTTVTNLLASKAPLASPLLSGKPKAPTPAFDADSDQIANVAYAKGIRSELQGGVSEALNTLAKLANALADKAPLVSPLLSGKPKAPTAPLTGDGSNNEQLANTQFVQMLLAAFLPKRSFAGNDFIRIPDVPGGLIIQFGSAVVSPEATYDVTLPISFNNIRGAIAGMGVSGWNNSGNYSAYAGLVSQSVIRLTQDVSSTAGAGNQTLYYLAWGN